MLAASSFLLVVGHSVVASTEEVEVGGFGLAAVGPVGDVVGSHQRAGTGQPGWVQCWSRW